MFHLSFYRLNVISDFYTTFREIQAEPIFFGKDDIIKNIQRLQGSNNPSPQILRM